MVIQSRCALHRVRHFYLHTRAFNEEVSVKRAIEQNFKALLECRAHKAKINGKYSLGGLLEGFMHKENVHDMYLMIKLKVFILFCLEEGLNEL